MREFLKKTKDYPITLVFFALLILLTVADLIYPDRESSELENKHLAQRPAFNMSSLVSNQWTSKYNEYVKEQVVGRDAWIDLHSRMETALLRKTQVGGMLIGKDAQLFTQMFNLTEAEQAQLPKNVQAVSEFAQRHPGKVTFLLAPSASLIQADRLPAFAPMLDENAYTEDILAQVGQSAQVLDVRELFTQNKDEKLYYYTDHHWTTQGAYLAYTAFCQQQGLTPFDRDAHTELNAKGFYGTSYSAARYWASAPDTITYYDLNNPLTIYQTGADGSVAPQETTGLYDLKKLDTRDKYAMFLHGNNGYSTIEGNGTGSILVIKDSYANCFIPFLTANYAKIGVVDLRNFKSIDPDALMEQEGYDQVLLLYNFQSFKSDGNLVYLNRVANRK